MYQTNAHDTYTQNHFSVESSEKLVQMLLEGVLRFNTLAKKAIRDKDIEKKTYWINRSNRVLAELISTIDFTQGDIANYLHGLYTYQLDQLTLANIETNSDRLDQVNLVVKGLNEAWKDSANVA